MSAHVNKATTPIVSVIIPTYNCELYIIETIDSVLSQTYNNIELIVVNDGSTDRTHELVAAYGSSVRLISQTNSGVCVARNRGIREAQGQYLCLIDHDDYWFPDKLEQQTLAIKTHPECGVIFSNFIPWHPDTAGRFCSPLSFDLSSYPEGINPDYSGWIYHQFLLDCWMLTSTALFRREVFDQCGFFDDSLPYSEDWDLWLRISREYQFLKLNSPTTLYRQHPQQGNRLVRNVDYRTQLLKKTVAKWGYCSRDGRCISSKTFSKKIADFHGDYALHHLRAGNLITSIKSLITAWLTNPLKIKFLIYIILVLVGWRPRQ
jgi:glycosyltransferase involved in cell wall biosynthesis